MNPGQNDVDRCTYNILNCACFFIFLVGQMMVYDYFDSVDDRIVIGRYFTTL